MEILAPSSQTTLLILLGASAWPFSPEFQNSEAFANAAQSIKAYFLHPGPFRLPPENLLDLFDSNHSPDELDVEMRRFLEQRMAAMKASAQAARDILVYYVGHGGFVGRDADFYLAIRRTRMDNPRPSGVQMISLAETLMEKVRHLRRIIILDCCFAAAAFSAFQSEPAQVALEKTRDAFAVKGKGTGFPGKGTVLLCSSNHTSPSLLLPDGSSTMFTKALVDTLMQGATPQHEYLSLREVVGLAAQVLMGIRNAPRPIVHSPDQSEGDIADIPFFPNPRAEEERALLERRRLGHYRLLRLLGSGGMGEVYLAEDARIGQQVAIKVIRAEGVAYPQSESAMKAARLFEREAKAIARLDHPNILPLFAYGEETLGEQVLTYLVMPYRKEGTLASWLRQRGRAAPLSPVEVAPLLQQAAEALQHAHTQHVIHQDVKPANFLIRLRDDHPDRPDLLLADFGIAKLMSASASASQSIRGTPTYMAPEQWDGQPVAASDQYALAIMVYELLVGRPPFQGNPSQVMRQHYLTLPPAPSSLNAHLSPAIDAVLLRALAKQPDERFPSVAAFARAFHEAMQSEEVLQATLAISRAEAESGTTRTLPLPGGRQVSVTVPAGVSDGSILRLEGQGMPYYEGGPAGPLVLMIAVQAEVSPPPLLQERAEPAVLVSMPNAELPSVEDQRMPPARPEAPDHQGPTSPASHESESAPAVNAPSLPVEGATPAHQTAPSAGMARSATPPAIRPDALAVVKPAKPGASRRLVLLGLAGLVIVALASGIVWFTAHPASPSAGIQASPTRGIQTSPTGSISASPALGITEFSVPTVYSDPSGIAAGPGGTLWFTEHHANKIGRISPSGTITEFPGGWGPLGITAGPDGNLWFTDNDNSVIGRISPSGTITYFPLPTYTSGPLGITAGPDGNLWFTESYGKIGRISPSGTITEFSAPAVCPLGLGIAAGPDGNLWFTECYANEIGRISPSGTITQFPLPSAAGGTFGIAAGPHGNLWFTEGSGKIGRITPGK